MKKKKKHEIKVRIDGVEKWVNANVWFDWMNNQIKSDIKKREETFISNVVSYGLENKIDKDIISRFCDYWGETNPNGRKMRWEMEKTFSIPKRIGTFLKNKKSWGANHQQSAAFSDAEVEKRYQQQQENLRRANQVETASEEEIKKILLKR